MRKLSGRPTPRRGRERSWRGPRARFAEGIECRTAVDEGDPADVLVRLAEECGADVLVIGNKDEAARARQRSKLGFAPGGLLGVRRQDDLADILGRRTTSAMANLFDPEFDQTQKQEGFRTRRAMLGKQAEAKRLGASLFEIEPGNAFPLHYHLGNEEMLIVVAGTPTLRTAEAERELAEGEIVSFPLGEQGAHQVINRTAGPVRILMLSEMIAPTSSCGPSRARSAPSAGHPAATARACTASTTSATRCRSGRARSRRPRDELAGRRRSRRRRRHDGVRIAQIAVLGGMETLLHDPDPKALHQGIERATAGAIERGVERGRWSPEQAVAALARLGAAPELDALAGRDLIVEAAPEDLELKRELFARLQAVTGERLVLATNTPRSRSPRSPRASSTPSSS